MKRKQYESEGQSKELKEDMRPEYDFSGGVRGKIDKEYMRGTNVVLLDPDVAAIFQMQ